MNYVYATYYISCQNLWNEAGQMVASIDNASCGYYGYDGNGNRTYKLTGQSVQDQYNAGEWQYYVNFNDAVLYVNPYFIVTPKGYTRHYYNGSQRIAAQIGRISDLPKSIIDTSAVARERIANAQAYMASILGATEKIDISTGDIADIDGDELEELQWQCLDTNTIVFHITLQSDTNMLLPVLNRDAGFPTNALDIYYYHADHLGSASWITNKEGTPIEYIHYMPYGELWYNWQASSYNERFKFTGKERDAETGYDYFGARYYSPTLLHWLAPDPLAGKYPDISPYAYCAWNPIKFIDPDGNFVGTAIDIICVGMDIYSLGKNLIDGNTQAALVDAGALVIDALSVLVPGATAGAGIAVKAVRAADKGKDMAHTTTSIVANSHNYRKALQQATGKTGKGYEAHHTLPQKLGLNLKRQELILMNQEMLYGVKPRNIVKITIV